MLVLLLSTFVSSIKMFQCFKLIDLDKTIFIKDFTTVNYLKMDS